jgi:YbbR-like protein
VNPNNNRNKNNKIKTFLLFLGMAILFWMLTKFSKESVAEVNVDLNYINVPVNAIISDRSPKHLSIEITANGFYLLNYALKDANLAVDLSQYVWDEQNTIHIDEQQLVELMKDQWDVTTIERISTRGLTVFLDTSISKRIPVVLISNISYKEGFKSIGGIKLSPDSITVSGPSEVIEKIDSAVTQRISLKNVESTYSKEIALLKSKAPLVSFHPENVLVKIEVEEFTQKTLTLPIELINVPNDLNVRIIPESLMINFEVAVKDFNQFNAANFRVICDFSEKITEGNFMIPKVVYHPEGVYKIDLATKKIEYLIFK